MPLNKFVGQTMQGRVGVRYDMLSSQGKARKSPPKIKKPLFKISLKVKKGLLSLLGIPLPDGLFT